MKRTMLFISIFMCLFGIVSATAQNPVLTPSDSLVKFAIPKRGYYYELEAGRNAVRVDWTVTGGSFSLTETKTSVITGSTDGIDVYWDNLKSSNDNAPSGKLTAEVYYDSSFGSKKTCSYTQKIQSLNGVTPPSLYSDSPENLDYGTKRINVKFKRAFLYPGQSSQVEKYEWTLPEGWTSGNQKGVFTTSSGSIDITTNNMGAGTVKVRGINRLAEFDKSEYASITFTRKFDYTAYPASVPYGKAQTHTFSTQLVKGMTYEWNVPSGWKINNGGNTKEEVELNSVSITTSVCPTDGAVKVRLKKNGEISQWLVCPYGGVTDPSITSTSAYQFEYSSLALDIAPSLLSEITWSGAGVHVVSGQRTTTPKVIFTKSGPVTVQVAFVLLGCSGKRTISKTFNVSPFRYFISGEPVVCSNGNYAIDNVTVPSEVQLNWSNTHGMLEILEGQGTKAVSVGIAPGKFGNDLIRLTARLGGESDAVSKSLYVGYPTVTEVSGPSSLRLNQGGSFVAAPLYNNNVCEYKWIVSPNQGVTQSPSRNTNYITFSLQGSYSVSCRAYTAQCGAAGSAASTTVSVQNSYMVYSNGSGKTVSVVESQLENDESPVLSNIAVPSLIAYQLYNQATGSLAADGKMERTGGTLDFSHVNSGIYILRIQVSDTVFEIHRVVLK